MRSSVSPFLPRSRWLVLAVAVAVLWMYADRVQRWWFTGDDAWISFRYARNLAEGYGLRFNIGEPPVEGFTNLSLVLMVAAGMLVGIEPDTTAHAVGVLSGLTVLFLLTAWSARRRGWDDPWVLAAPAALVACRSFAAWTTGGLETQLFAALVLAALLRASEEHLEGADPRGSGILLSLALLTRPDALLPAAWIGVLVVSGAVQGRRPWHDLARWAAPWTLTLAGLTVFRLAWFGDVVPNTARVKLGGLFVQQGARWIELLHTDYAAGYLLPLLLIPVLLRRRADDLLLGATVLSWLGWLYLIGGDRFDLRMAVFIAGPALWLVTEGIAMLVRPLGCRGAVLGAAAGLLLASTLYGRSQVSVAPIRDDVESLQWIESFARRRLAQGEILADLVQRGAIPADTLIAVGAAGALPYASRLPTLDLFGLSDRWVARHGIRGRRRIVAHEKQAPPSYVAEQQVVLADLSGWMVARNPRERKEAEVKVRDKLGWYDPDHQLRLACLEHGDGWLIFATPLSEAALSRAVPALEACDGKEPAPKPRRGKRRKGRRGR